MPISLKGGDMLAKKEISTNIIVIIDGEKYMWSELDGRKQEILNELVIRMVKIIAARQGMKAELK